MFAFTLITKRTRNKSEDDESGRKKGKQIPISEMYIAFATNVSVRQAPREPNLMPKEYRKR